MPQVSGAPSMGAFTSFNMSGLSLLHTMVIPLVIVFTIADALAPYVVEGGSWLKVFFNLSITCVISGLCLIVLPEVANVLFTTVKL
jgi:archaellum biogenesis protein FlaJ (TadC family)